MVTETKSERPVETTDPEKIKFTPCLVVFTGPACVGKTTLGRKLAEITNFSFFDVDETRWKIFEKVPSQGFPDELPEPRVTFAMLTAYQANHEQARDAVWQNQPVILAASYSRQPYHEMLKSLQKTVNVPLKVFLLQTSDSEAEKRLEKRKDEDGPSNVMTLAHYQTKKARQTSIEGVENIIIDTTKPIEESVQEILSYLQEFRLN